MTGAIAAFVRQKTIVETYRSADSCPPPMTGSLRRRFTVERLQGNRFFSYGQEQSKDLRFS